MSFCVICESDDVDEIMAMDGSVNADEVAPGQFPERDLDDGIPPGMEIIKSDGARFCVQKESENKKRAGCEGSE